jgi:hypothetical protein
MTSTFAAIDRTLLALFAAGNDPVVGYLLGTAVLALVAAVASILTLAVARRIAGSAGTASTEEARHYQQLSQRALAAGNGDAYRACNRLANEAFGRSFFLNAAWAMGSLWPAFFAAGWIQMHFASVRFPIGPLELGPLAPLVMLYIAWRLLLGVALHSVGCGETQPPFEIPGETTS